MEFSTSPPWSSIIDGVAVTDGGVGDLTYAVPVLGPNYDGLISFAPGGASRIPDGYDTNSACDWVRNDFNLAGIPGFPGTPISGEAFNTPGAFNLPVDARVPEPTSLLLLGTGLGVIGLAAFRRKK